MKIIHTALLTRVCAWLKMSSIAVNINKFDKLRAIAMFRTLKCDVNILHTVDCVLNFAYKNEEIDKALDGNFMEILSKICKSLDKKAIIATLLALQAEVLKKLDKSPVYVIHSKDFAPDLQEVQDFFEVQIRDLDYSGLHFQFIPGDLSSPGYLCMYKDFSMYNTLNQVKSDILKCIFSSTV